MAEEAGPALGRTLEQAAERVGAYRWLELRSFELTGHWAGGDALASAQLYFDRLSMEHAWHAELWAERLPVLDWIDPQSLTRPPNPAAADLLARLAEGGREPQATIVRLAGLVRLVLPRLVTSYRLHLEATSPAADGPLSRALRLVLADERSAWEDGETLLQRVLTSPDRSELAAQTQRELEVVLTKEVGPGWFG